MKKIVSLVLAISMVLSTFASVFAASRYTDLTEGNNAKYYAGAVEALTELGVIDGFNGEDGSKTYGPEKELTRAQLAKMLVVCTGLGKEVESLASRTVFSDVDSSSWAAGWINAAAQSKIIAGYPDGTFKPTKNVNYAEAFTMALRALGYGNVVDAEGTWPTAYMLKARELKLTDGLVGQYQASTPATRGNTAVLLWNMLKTPMWKIYEESEGNGMTLSARGDYMLNVKFPDYRYAENAYIKSIDVDDAENVKLTIFTDPDEVTDRELVDEYTAFVKNVDITRLVDGMKVTVLIKDFKDEEDKTFITVVPTNTKVEGFVTDFTIDEDNKDVVDIKVDDVEYKFNAKYANRYVEFPWNDVHYGAYVVFEADGKKVKSYNGEYVIKSLPIDGKEVEEDTVKKMESDIDEDDLVIRNGEWASVEDVKVGDVYSKVEFDSGYAWAVVDGVKESVFESLTTETKKINGERIRVYYLEADGDKLFVPLGEGLEAYDGADNDSEVRLATLQEDEKDNKYLDKDVEIVSNFVGSPLKLKFGDVDELTTGGSYYVIASNGAWSATAKGGKVYNITLVGQDGEENDYEFARNAEVPEIVKDNEEIYREGTPLFAWVKFDDDEKIKDMIILDEYLCPIVSGDQFEGVKYKSKYTVVALESGEKFDKNDNQFEITEVPVKGGQIKPLKANAGTIVYTVKAVLDNDDKVTGFDVEVTTGLDAISNKEMPNGSFAAYDATKKTARAAYVFIADDPESADLEFGLVENYEQSSRRGKNYVTVNGTEYVLDEAEVDFAEEDVIGFTLKNDKATVKTVITVDDLDDSWIMDKDSDSESIIFSNVDEELDLDKDSDDYEKYEDYSVVEVAVSSDKKLKLSFDSAEELSTTGLAAVKVKKGNRIIIRDEDEVIYVFTGLTDKDGTDDGYLTDHIPQIVSETSYAVEVVSDDGVDKVESGDTFKLTATVTEDGRVVDYQVSWSATPEGIVEITDNGDNTADFTAKASGDVTITATYETAAGEYTVKVVDGI
jgi:hypothetical protein